MLTAYDLATGAEVWQIGGPRTGEPFERPLAGTFFFGTPTPADNELYAIGERDNEVSLFVLDRDTGRPLFQQPLANAEARIDLDASRRLWACSPAVSNGIVVCPTTTGWTVAVDRQERRLLWAHASDTSPPDDARQNFGTAVLHPLHPLNVRWETSPPVISGRRVIVAPQELPDAFHGQEPVVLCLDLETGQELWREPKQDEGLYVGGVAEGCVLIVGRNRVRGLSLTDGSELWAVTLLEDAPPSGRGLISGDAFLLPLANGRLWSIRIADGTVSSRLEFTEGESPLGNLVLSRGQLISVDALDVRSFSDRTALETEIARRRASQPDDLWAANREAQLRAVRGEREPAVAILERAEAAADAPQADAALVAEFNRLWKSCLVDLATEDLQERNREFDLLCRRIDPRHDLDVRKLAVDRALARRDAAAAWGLLWPPAADAEQWLQAGPLAVRLAEWERGRLAEVYSLAGEELRKKIDAAFSAAVDAAGTAEASRAEQLRLERRIGFHPQGVRLTHWLADAAATRGDFAGAEIRWRRLWQSGSSATSVQAGLKLANWLAQHDLTPDAQRLRAELETRLAGLSTTEQAGLHDELAARVRRGRQPRQSRPLSSRAGPTSNSP